MRETCARVLAAALMTGAIAFALAMPALFDTAHDLGRELTSPPSSLQRYVHVPARPRSAGTGRAGGSSAAQTVGRPAARPQTDRLRHGYQSLSARRSAPARPRPKPNTPAPASPAAEPETRELSSTTPEPAQPAAPAPPPSDDASTCRKSKGNGKGHCKPKDTTAHGTPPPAAPPAPAPSQPPAASPQAPAPAQPPAEDDSSKEHGQGKGHAYGHGK